jgi:hypothetical protein
MFGDIVEEDLDEHKSARNCDDNLKEPNHVIRNTATQNLVKEIKRAETVAKTDPGIDHYCQ